MAGISWWRSWHGAPMDHKWPVIAAKAGVKVGMVAALAWALIDYASQHENRGTVTGFDVETYAVYSGFSEDEVQSILNAMTAKGFIVDGRLPSWERRQPQREDNSTERVRKHREAVKRSVTHGNAPDTDTEKDTDTEQDKETDKDKEKETEPEARPVLFSMYEREIGIITQRMAETLIQAEKDYPLDWFIDAFKEAVDHNARNWKYVEAILRRWKTQGRKDLPEKSNGKPKQYKEIMVDGERMFQEVINES